jgi:hypothetical protein
MSTFDNPLISRTAPLKSAISNVVSMVLSNHPASLMLSSATGCASMGGPNASPTQASTFSAPPECSP